MTSSGLVTTSRARSGDALAFVDQESNAREHVTVLPPLRGVLERYWIVESVTVMGVSS